MGLRRRSPIRRRVGPAATLSIGSVYGPERGFLFLFLFFLSRRRRAPPAVPASWTVATPLSSPLRWMATVLEFCETSTGVSWCTPAVTVM